MISIIVPVYNVDTFLRKCVDSILSQSYKNFELILVDDGSTDNSGNICDYYASIDKRVRVIHKINGGVGSARNTGMSIAKGRYITFIDSDDYVEPEYLSAFFRVPILSEYFYVRAEAAIDKGDTVWKNENTDYCLNNEQLGQDIERYNLLAKGAPWAKLFSLELIKNIGLKFPIDINFHEDHYFVIKYISACARYRGQFIYIGKPYYHYVQHDKISLTKKKRGTVEECKIFNYMLEAIEENVSLINYNNKYIMNILTSCSFASLLSGIKQASTNNDFKYIFNITKNIKFKHIKVVGKKANIIKLVLLYCPQIIFRNTLKIIRKYI